MNRYLNLGGASGVASWKQTADGLEVGFRDGHVYLYTGAITGQMHVARMTDLAVQGRGLNSYINRYVRKRYAARIN